MKKRAVKKPVVEEPQREVQHKISAKTENQKNYVRAICESDLVICTGPSGTGKSMIAVGLAIEHLLRGNIEYIVFTRPVIECGNKGMGFLPGTKSEKFENHTYALTEYIKHFSGELYNTLISKDKIRFQPLEYMRGSTFNNSYIILDEAQNASFEQLVMVSTRLGNNSKLIVNGDVKQTDMGAKSGFNTYLNKLRSVQEVSIIEMDRSDILRNGLIAKLLVALED